MKLSEALMKQAKRNFDLMSLEQNDIARIGASLCAHLFTSFSILAEELEAGEISDFPGDNNIDNLK